MCFVSFVPGPGQLRSFKRPGYLEVRPEKSRFFLATNLGWRSANATSGLVGVNRALHIHGYHAVLSRKRLPS